MCRISWVWEFSKISTLWTRSVSKDEDEVQYMVSLLVSVVVVVVVVVLLHSHSFVMKEVERTPIRTLRCSSSFLNFFELKKNSI